MILLEHRKVNQYVFSKHHILPGYESNNIVEIARDNIGIHSARLQSPYTMYCSRSLDFEPNMLWTSLFKSNELIKLRCMRTTLHIVPLDLAPILHSATLKLRLSTCELYYRKNNVDLVLINQLKSKIIESVKRSPMTSTEIEKYLLDVCIGKELIRFVIKDLWERGILCYINNTKEWGKEKRLYAITQAKYKNMNLDNISESEAQKSLVYMYINQFGPVTFKDIVWWSGLSPVIIKKMVNALSNKVLEIKLVSCSRDYYMTNEDYNNYENFEPTNITWVKLLAYEDSSLKGYFETRDRYVDMKYYNDIFNQIGEVRASIIIDGMVAGTWSWNKAKREIDWTMFYKVSSDHKKMIIDIISDYEYRLNYKSRQMKLFE